MRIAGVGTAFPPNYYSQEEISAALKHQWAGKLDRPEVIDRLHSNVGVKSRHLTLQRDDVSVANLISSGLFGDGAAAVLISGSDREHSGPAVLATRSSFYPGTEGVMGWDISENGFRIVLSPDVPKMVHEHLAAD